MEEFLYPGGRSRRLGRRGLRPGDFVSYEAGTHHNSRTVNGCLITVFEWQWPGGITQETG
jgi:hypothetical protein